MSGQVSIYCPAYQEEPSLTMSGAQQTVGPGNDAGFIGHKTFAEL